MPQMAPIWWLLMELLFMVNIIVVVACLHFSSAKVFDSRVVEMSPKTHHKEKVTVYLSG